MAPVPYAAYRPAPRPPAEPERPWWRTVSGWGRAAGWTVIVGALVLLVVGFVRGSAQAGQRAVEEREVTREQEHMRMVNAWVQDTAVDAPPPDGTGRPAPTSDRAKRMWVISRMLVERSLWEREILKRHGVGGRGTPAAWNTPRYQGSARDYPEVGTYLEGRVAAFAEIEKDSAAWMNERVAALARESGMPAREIHAILPSGFAGVTPEERREADVMLEVHRHYVRIDPRVRHVGGNQLRYQQPDDARITDELVAKLHAAYAATNHARERVRRERIARSHQVE